MPISNHFMNSILKTCLRKTTRVHFSHKLRIDGDVNERRSTSVMVTHALVDPVLRFGRVSLKMCEYCIILFFRGGISKIPLKIPKEFGCLCHHKLSEFDEYIYTLTSQCIIYILNRDNSCVIWIILTIDNRHRGSLAEPKIRRAICKWLPEQFYGKHEWQAENFAV